MGDWRVLKAWNTSDKYHDCSGGPDPIDIVRFGCSVAVEQHQDDPLAPAPTPEFDIEVRYWSPANSGPDNGRFKTGWRYVIQWEAPQGVRRAGRDISGDAMIESLYGFPTPDRAKQAAEYRATQIAQGYVPVEKYKFTPEV